MPNPIPYAINRRDDGLMIEWDRAGHQALYPARALRLQSWAANRPKTSANVRHWLYQHAWIVTGAKFGWWHGGHGTGIYTFEHLLAACPCERCRGRRAEHVEGA